MTQAGDTEGRRYIVIDVSVGDAGATARPAVYDTAADATVKVYRRPERHLAQRHADTLNGRPE